MVADVLQLGERITCLPVIHGSGDFALAVRRLMLEQSFDCVAVPLPPSFQTDVESAIELLPSPTIVTQPEQLPLGHDWNPDAEWDSQDSDAESDDIDPDED